MKSLKEEINELEQILIKTQKYQKKDFKKGEIISNYLLKRRQICILLQGTADLIRYETNGDKIIIERYRKNDIFGEVFHPLTTSNELFVQAKEDCSVLFFLYDDSTIQAKLNSKYLNNLNQTLLNVIFYKTISQNTRIEILSRTSIREKILFYLEQMENRNLRKTFELNFSYTDLADYLNVNRSAMMREFSHLEEDGFIKRQGKKITMLY